MLEYLGVSLKPCAEYLSAGELLQNAAPILEHMGDRIYQAFGYWEWKSDVLGSKRVLGRTLTY